MAGASVYLKSLGDGMRTAVVVIETDVGSWNSARVSPTCAIVEGTYFSVWNEGKLRPRCILAIP